MKINRANVQDEALNITTFKPCDTLGFYGRDDVRQMQDAALSDAGIYNMLKNEIYGYVPNFLGYAALANLAQDGVIRAGVELRSEEMTRKWIDFTYKGEQEGEQAAADIISDMTRFHIDRIIREATDMCGYFGGCLVYIDTGNKTDEELRLPLGEDGDTFAIDSIKGFKVIEPSNVAPMRYNCFSPIDKNYFVPQAWLVMGKEIHASRFLYFSEGKPPTMLLPSYNFFGIPLAQTVADVVAGFTESREAATRLLKKFSLTIFKTDMSELLSGNVANNVRLRVQYFAQNRDNDGIMTVDKDAEDIIGIATPLSGVTDIVRQQMEIVAAYFGEPAVKLWGISPGGFNSTGESDIQSHYDHIHAMQEKLLRDPMERLIKLLQLNRRGTIDENLTFEFCPLSDEDKQIRANVQKTKADTMAVLFDRGIIDGMEARSALADDPESGFANIDSSKEIEVPEVGLEFESPEGVTENGL